MEKTQISYQKLQQDVEKLSEKIDKSKYDGVYAIPRGGVPVAALLSAYLGVGLLNKEDLEGLTPQRVLVVDDLIDSGKTIDEYIKAGHDVAVLYRKSHSPLESSNLILVETIDGWIELPYENTESDLEDNIERLKEYQRDNLDRDVAIAGYHLALTYLSKGENLKRDDMGKTPTRYIKAMEELTTPEHFEYTAFDNPDKEDKGMIIQGPINFISSCAHHTFPFQGEAWIAYIPGEKIVGLSKLARAVKSTAKRFGVQEEITNDIATTLAKELKPLGVAVYMKASHGCMAWRGVKADEAQTITTKLVGAFKEKSETRQEFFDAIKG